MNRQQFRRWDRLRMEDDGRGRGHQQPMTLPTFEAVCVTGEDHDCGATSGELHARRS